MGTNNAIQTMSGDQVSKLIESVGELKGSTSGIVESVKSLMQSQKDLGSKVDRAFSEMARNNKSFDRRLDAEREAIYAKIEGVKDDTRENSRRLDRQKYMTAGISLAVSVLGSMVTFAIGVWTFLNNK